MDMTAEKKSDAVTVYVRARIAEMDATYGRVAEVLRLGGLQKNAAAKLRSGAGVGPSTEPLWARALGYATVDELRAAAFVHAQAADARPLTAAHREAIERAKPLGQMTDADAERIVRAAPQFWDRPVDWWLSHLLAEYSYVRSVREREARDARYQSDVRAEKRRLTTPAPAPPPAPVITPSRKRTA